jgi:predicted TIM-barrel fold metal-dependent hydrolase
VDVDVHEMLNEMLTSIKDLVPHLDEPLRSRVAINDGCKGPPGNPYAFPQATGVAIQDAVTDDGSPAGSKLDLLQEQVLDQYGIEPAILVCLFHPTDHQIQPEFAVALASAYNDWVLENWLDREERLRSSITVAAQEPLEAAREIDRVGSDPRFVQVILPAVAHHAFGRQYYWPIFEAAQRNDLVVAFHQSGGTRTAVGLPPYYIRVAHGHQPGLAVSADRPDLPRRLRRVRGVEGRDGRVELDLGPPLDVALRL